MPATVRPMAPMVSTPSGLQTDITPMSRRVSGSSSPLLGGWMGAVAVACLVAGLSWPATGWAQESAPQPAAAVEQHAEDHGHASAGSHAGDHGGGSSTPPGLVPEFDLVIWSLIVFAAFVFLLSKFAWKPLAAGLDQREARIRNDINEAESARLKAQQMLAEHEARLAKAEETVRDLITEAKKDAEKVRVDLMATAEADVQSLRKRAVAEIEQARDTALQQLFDTLSTNVMEATTRVVGRSLTGEDHQRLVQDALAELNIRRN